MHVDDDVRELLPWISQRAFVEIEKDDSFVVNQQLAEMKSAVN
jgi:hypothetical protein